MTWGPLPGHKEGIFHLELSLASLATLPSSLCCGTQVSPSPQSYLEPPGHPYLLSWFAWCNYNKTPFRQHAFIPRHSEGWEALGGASRLWGAPSCHVLVWQKVELQVGKVPWALLAKEQERVNPSLRPP